jgi:undecaprenyl-diphosphatase
LDLDSSLLHHVIQLRRPWLDDVMLFASALGAGGFLWIIFGSIAGIFPRHTAGMWRLWLAIAFTFVVVDDVAKPLANRARPFETLPDIQVIDARPGSESFPSGHAAIAVAGALAATRMIPPAGWILWPVAATVSISRIYIGVHWPSDVIGGALIGLACAWFVLGGRTTAELRPPQN